MIITSITTILLAGLTVTFAQNVTVFVHSEYQYLLPTDFTQSNFSVDWLPSTTTSNTTVQDLLTAAAKAPFVAYDQEFYSIFGPNPQLKLVASSETEDFFEAGVWDPKRQRVWFSGGVLTKDYVISVVDLKSGEVSRPNITPPVLVPNGGYYFDDVVYITDFGSETEPPSVKAINPDTYTSQQVVNSYFGLRLNGPDDLAWIKKDGKHYMFFSDPPYTSSLNISGPPTIPDAIWRYDPQSQDMQVVIGRSDNLVPNGVATNANTTKLYVTDTSSDLEPIAPGAQANASPAIYEYDIDEVARPVNKRLFGTATRYTCDGIKVDDEGRVWTGEGNGIVIRNKFGKVIGMINAAGLGTEALTNFAIAGDLLVIGGYKDLWTVNLTRVLMDPARFYS